MGITVLCADDSKHVLAMIVRLISSMPEVDKVHKVTNGEEAVRYVTMYNPDIITLDLKMPILDGLQALKKIRSISSIPVIMVSSYTQPGAFATIEALEEGAFGFISKPASGRPDDMLKMRDDLEKMIRAAVSASKDKEEVSATSVEEESIFFRPDRKDFDAIASKLDDNSFFTIEQKKCFEAVVIGCSAGGPRALSMILPQIPAWFPWPILIVQHMPGFFTSYFARTLDQKCALTVKEAVDGETAKPGFIYIAPGENHMRIRKLGGAVKISLDSEFPEVSGARPSVDVLLDSVAASIGDKAVGIILSGMGIDGANGMLKMKKAGAVTVVQDRQSSLIYGMAGTALKLGAVGHVVNLDDLPLFLLYSPIARKTHIGEV
ncbi:MAG: chemotaxis-specific protein-glutamate methyltransferase CheB [Bacteroidales bacterium]|nr:chemotaxis-specific protein-glutamate methyltransferase CheB [Candidatus Latescibacterota bacterium]